MRWRHRMGFGVQSPWAYEFVSDVLFGKHRYYAFDTLNGTRSDEQLFRICAWLNPQTVYVHGATQTTESYLRSSAKSGSFYSLFYYASACAADAERAVRAGEITPPACIILEDILRPAVRNVWDALLRHPDATASFDLGRRGILFFDPSRHKQNYLI